MISALLPTRKRPGKLQRFVESLEKTATHPPLVEVVAYIDDDDTLSLRMAKALCIKYVVGPRITLSACWDKCLPLAKGDILFHASDDLVFKTNGWDVMVEQAFRECEDKILMVHGNDCQYPGMFGIAPFVSRKWVETLGYFIPPYFAGDFCDNWLNQIAGMIGRRKYLPFEIEHMHHLFGKAELDETARERIAKEKAYDAQGLYDSLLPERLDAVMKLRAAMAAPVSA